VYDLDEDFAISNISEQTMQEGDSATLTWAGVLHTITLAEVGADFVRLLIESPLINITINVTETTEVDLDGDGIADLAITLDKIEDGRASLTFTKLVPAPPPVIKCPEPAPEPGPWGPCINGTQERRVYECIEGNWVEKTESKSCVVLPPPLVPPALPLWPAAVVVILLLVAGYWFFIKPKKKPKK
jgi:DNA-binding transcriptional LysR family regulator